MAAQAEEKGRRSLLIVDDSRLSRDLLESLLKDRDPRLEIDGAGSADEALSRIAQRRYDLVTLDINMPGMSGEELAGRIDGRMPVCFVTSNIQRPLRERLEQRFGPVINKPITAATITDLLALLEGGA